MTNDEMFEELKKKLYEGMKQEKGNKEQELQAALLFLGLDLLRSALGDLKRIADAQETLAYNANHRLSDGR